MKRNFIYSMLAIASMGFALGACSNEDVVDNVLSATQAPITRAAEDVVAPAEGFGYHEVDFLAGQHMLAGKISVWNDYANVYVKFTTTGNWVIKKTHLYVGSKEVLLDPANGYVNKKGDVAPGKLPIKDDFKPYQTEKVYTIPFAELIGYEGIEWPVVNDPENYDEAKAAYDWILEHEICPVVAAHAEVCELVLNEGTGEWVEKNGQTAWGDGINFVTGDKKGNGSWSMYFDGNCVEFPEPVIPEEPEPDPIEPAEPTYEYSYVNSNTGWACILDDEYHFNHQWADFIPYYGEEKTVNIYAGNPKNDPESKIAGTVTITPAEEGYVTITLNVVKDEAPENNGAWMLNPNANENVKIQGYEKAPSDLNPAPGQFNADTKAHNTYEFKLKATNFYAIHLDMAQLVVTKVEAE